MMQEIAAALSEEELGGPQLTPDNLVIHVSSHQVGKDVCISNKIRLLQPSVGGDNNVQNLQTTKKKKKYDDGWWWWWWQRRIVKDLNLFFATALLFARVMLFLNHKTNTKNK